MIYFILIILFILCLILFDKYSNFIDFLKKKQQKNQTNNSESDSCLVFYDVENNRFFLYSVSKGCFEIEIDGINYDILEPPRTTVEPLGIL